MPPIVNYSHVSMMNPLLRCAASNTVDSHCLTMSISMSVNTISLVTTELSAYLNCTFQIVLMRMAKRRLPIAGLYT